MFMCSKVVLVLFLFVFLGVKSFTVNSWCYLKLQFFFLIYSYKIIVYNCEEQNQECSIPIAVESY